MNASWTATQIIRCVRRFLKKPERMRELRACVPIARMIDALGNGRPSPTRDAKVERLWKGLRAHLA